MRIELTEFVAGGGRIEVGVSVCLVVCAGKAMYMVEKNTLFSDFSVHFTHSSAATFDLDI